MKTCTETSHRGQWVPNGCFSLEELPVGKAGKVVKYGEGLRNKKKFADLGIIPGARLTMEGHAPFGGLRRVRVLESSISLHSEDAAHIILASVE